MGNIWSAYHEGEDHGGLDWAGIWAVGDLLTDGLHPWGRTNPWAYDGAIYGYRELGTLGASNYWLLGQRMYVTNPTAESDATYAAELINLNDGCNYDWRGTAMATITTSTVDATTMRINCPSDGGDPMSITKAAMAAWGIARDIQTFNSPGPADAIVSTAAGLDAGTYFFAVTLPSTAARDHWIGWAGEVITLWLA